MITECVIIIHVRSSPSVQVKADGLNGGSQPSQRRSGKANKAQG